NIAPLSNKTFHPYTDLLLHDMGPGLDNGYTEGSATKSEWRTPPLWGLGLSPNSQGGQYFLLHDGRAKSIEEAILLHGG
ncbi:di-heme oxidoredictase family protein, partial [Staphylococcus aureus]